jgi:hypothetical protein
VSALVPNLNELHDHLAVDSPGAQAVLCFDWDSVAEARSSLRDLVDGWARPEADSEEAGLSS